MLTIIICIYLLSGIPNIANMMTTCCVGAIHNLLRVFKKFMDDIINVLNFKYGCNLTETDRLKPYVKIRCINPEHSDLNPSLSIYPHTNSYYCFGCGITGNVGHLLNDSLYNTGKSLELSIGIKCLEYLRKRGVSDEIIHKCEVYGIDDFDDSFYINLNIPKESNLFRKGGTYLIYISSTGVFKFRSLNKEIDSRDHFYYKSDDRDKGYFLCQFDHKIQSLTIVEGEIDALVMASRGEINVLALQGASNTKNVMKYIPETRFGDMVDIQLYLDNDDSGVTASKNIIQNLLRSNLIERCFVTSGVFEGKDPAEAFKDVKIIDKSQNINIFSSILITKFGKDLDRVEEDKIVYFITTFINDLPVRIRTMFKSKLLETYRRVKHNTRFKLEFATVDKAIKEIEDLSNEDSPLFKSLNSEPYWKTGFSHIDQNFRMNESNTIIISGVSGAGKTTFAINMLLNNLGRSTKCCLISLELSKTTILCKLCQIVKRRNLNIKSNEYNFAIADSNMCNTYYEDIIAYIREICRRQPDFKVFIIDHSEAISFTKDASIDKYNAQNEFMESLVHTCVNYKITVILLMQQTKQDTSTQKFVSECYKGASSFKERADLFVQIDPETISGKPTDNKSIKVLRVYKNRYGVSSTYITDNDGSLQGQKLKFNGFTFEEMSKPIYYEPQF